MLRIENLSYSVPGKDLYNKISFSLDDGQHCAFIGASGSGKSTLTNIIMDPERYMYDGRLEIDRNQRTGYVSQFSELDKTREVTVFQYIGEEFIKLQNEINSIFMEMETASDTDALLERYQETLDAYNAIDGDNFESNIRKKLSLANLNKHENLFVSKLSGGEFKLIQVIKEMLTSTGFMIMDEPDVFLDFENLNSLKNLINSYKGTLLIITHNRYLLNHCFNKIIHLENAELQEFDGRYIDYNFSLLQSKIELHELAIADEEEIKRYEKIVDKLRMRATTDHEASRGKSLNAKVKYLERLEARKIKAPFVDIKQPKISLVADNVFPETIALKINAYNVAFDEMLLENISFEINSTDKVALIGPNGTGKTTLLREIYANNHDSIEINEDTHVAFLSQLQGEMLNESNTVLNELLEAGFKTNDQVKAKILDYGFEEKALHQKIESLSGGEKNLLQLIKISNTNANLLLLDEPTSHLDTYSQIALEKAMESYDGAFLMVSHDFYSIVNCVDYVLIIEEKAIRKMSIRKFRKMIYANHFGKEYLEIEQKKKAVETKIELALKDRNFTSAKRLCNELEELIKLL